jgi:hypothetical protein
MPATSTIRSIPGSTRQSLLRAALALALALAAPLGSAANEMLPVRAAASAARRHADSSPSTADLEKVGEARLKFLLWSVYDSRLFTPSGDYREGDRPLKLEVTYLLNVKADALIERTLTEWEAMGRAHPRQDEWAKQLASIWVDIDANDTLSLELDRENRATFRRNGELLGQIEDPEFGQEFVDIWLSPDCTRPEIRTALLGRNG